MARASMLFSGEKPLIYKKLENFLL